MLPGPRNWAPGLGTQLSRAACLLPSSPALTTPSGCFQPSYSPEPSCSLPVAYFLLPPGVCCLFPESLHFAGPWLLPAQLFPPALPAQLSPQAPIDPTSQPWDDVCGFLRCSVITEASLPFFPNPLGEGVGGKGTSHLLLSASCCSASLFKDRWPRTRLSVSVFQPCQAVVILSS